ncbi:MAG: histidine kinase [Sphingobacteriales bacterium]|nr:MAG: histidine kinase [Sphingobacteriales bacterium]
MNLIVIPAFYFNMMWVYPRYFKKAAYKIFALIQVLIIVSLIAIYGFVIFLLLQDTGGPFPWIFLVMNYLFVIMAGYSYMILKDSLKDEKVQNEKENITLKSELQFLRWQISPHFIFNVLNNMMALARTKSDKLEPMILKLATVIRYMLYEKDDTRITLEKEAEYITSYIELQSIRLGKDVKVITNFDVENNVGYSIEPMLLIPFVENAFKHGTGVIINPVININMELRGDALHFSVENKYMPRYSRTDGSQNGIGLFNVQRRLNLLYEHRHELKMTIEDGWYIATLKLKLS